VINKNIKIFFGSSIVDFKKERISVELFIRRISVLSENRHGIKLTPVFCENFDDAVALLRKQDEYNQKLRDSDLSFFIFFTRAGQFTVEEFEIAMESYRERSKPRVYVYFKNLLAEDEIDQSLVDFKKRLAETDNYYSGNFTHIDTVKFRILLALKQLLKEKIEIKIDSGNCLIYGEKHLSLSNIDEFTHNENLQKIRSELEEDIKLISSSMDE